MRRAEMSIRVVKMNMNTKTGFAVCIAALSGMWAASTAMAADSVKTQWPTNGHYYKRFDNATINWEDSAQACKKLGAHLATITSSGEQAFMQDLILGYPVDGYFAIGASDMAVEGAWQWVTGEAKDGWTYSNWGGFEPSDGAGENYMYMRLAKNSSSNGKWYSFGASTSLGYVCEWSTNHYVATATVPDQNGNGFAEDAVLYVDFTTSNHVVVLRDRQGPAHAKVGISLTFAKNDIPPKGLAVIADTNGNGKPEVGVLDVNYATNVLAVRVKDISNNASYLRTVNFFTSGAYVPVSLSVEPDSNGNGADELTVLAVKRDTGKAYSETRDSKTGALISANAY